MPLRPYLPVLLLAFALSLIVGVLAATRDAGVTLALAAALFGLQVLFVLARINAPLWSDANPMPADADWAWSNTVLTALVYAWGAAAMFSIYALSGLRWQHWWQYGAGMTLLAVAALFCANYLVGGRGRYTPAKSLAILMGVTVAQTIAVAGALVYFFAAGKLYTTRADWAANDVFLTGGFTVGIVSIVSLLAYRRHRAMAGPSA
jgi:hypothetical protein